MQQRSCTSAIITHPVRHPNPLPRSEPFILLGFFSDLVLILTDDFLTFPSTALVFYSCMVLNVICLCDFFLSKPHAIWMSHSSNCVFSVSTIRHVIYASFNMGLEWHILEPQIISTTATFKLLKMLEGICCNSLPMLDTEKTRNNRLGLEQQRFRFDMGARCIFNFPEARNMRHQRDCFVRFKPFTLQFLLMDTYLLQDYHTLVIVLNKEMNLPQRMHNTRSPCFYSSAILNHPIRK